MSHNALSCLKEILAPVLRLLLLKKVLTSIGGRFFSIGLDLHSTGDSGVSFTSGKIGDMDESVVESGLDVANTEVHLVLVLVLRAGGSEVNDLLFFDNLWWLYDTEMGWLGCVLTVNEIVLRRAKGLEILVLPYLIYMIYIE
jgi:hypothetical protein